LDTAQFDHIGSLSGSESLYQRSILFSHISQNVNCVSTISEIADLFGFEKAIQLDHLTDKQINELEEILKDYQ
jgi:hypothetical protein